MKTTKDLLEQYLEAKDLNRPDLILDCYTADALLTYSIATDTISFPARVSGADAIARTLVRDFRKKFDRCKTYYVCDSLAGDAGRIDFLPWLVIMRQISNKALRLGRGWYRWRFERGPARMRICAMHIHIERMDIIEDRDGEKLHELHEALPYPWLAPAILRESFEWIISQRAGFAFLEGFQLPVRVTA